MAMFAFRQDPKMACYDFKLHHINLDHVVEITVSDADGRGEVTIDAGRTYFLDAMTTKRLCDAMKLDYPSCFAKLLGDAGETDGDKA